MRNLDNRLDKKSSSQIDNPFEFECLNNLGHPEHILGKMGHLKSNPDREMLAICVLTPTFSISEGVCC